MNNAQAKQKQNGGCKHVKIERSIKSIFNGFLLKMLLRSLPVYILKQLFFSISVNSGRIFTEPRSSMDSTTVCIFADDLFSFAVILSTVALPIFKQINLEFTQVFR